MLAVLCERFANASIVELARSAPSVKATSRYTSSDTAATTVITIIAVCISDGFAARNAPASCPIAPVPSLIALLTFVKIVIARMIVVMMIVTDGGRLASISSISTIVETTNRMIRPHCSSVSPFSSIKSLIVCKTANRAGSSVPARSFIACS